ncbi:DUF805 domain-containing protein [Lysobacter terrae]
MKIHYLECVTRKYADFNGRAGREEYWTYMLVHYVIWIGVLVLSIAIEPHFRETALAMRVLWLVWQFATAFPRMAVTCRRLHDTNQSGWVQLIHIFDALLFVGTLVIFVICAQRAVSIGNKYGSEPLASS